eukprot:1158597-Pelagomonas_calceolata.AAC.5
MERKATRTATAIRPKTATAMEQKAKDRTDMEQNATDSRWNRTRDLLPNSQGQEQLYLRTLQEGVQRLVASHQAISCSCSLHKVRKGPVAGMQVLQIRSRMPNGWCPPQRMLLLRHMVAAVAAAAAAAASQRESAVRPARGTWTVPGCVRHSIHAGLCCLGRACLVAGSQQQDSHVRLETRLPVYEIVDACDEKSVLAACALYDVVFRGVVCTRNKCKSTPIA